MATAVLMEKLKLDHAGKKRCQVDMFPGEGRQHIICGVLGSASLGISTTVIPH